MRLLRAPLALAAMLAGSGCGYIHFGRLPESTMPAGDTAMVTAYSDLRTEHKILQQELALARREGDTLRAALDKNGGSSDLAARLQDTTRELAELRASYAKLSDVKSAAAPSSAGPAASPDLKAIEEKLATALRNYTQLEAENARLRADVTRTREENTTLATQLKASAAQNEQAQAALAQLNTELLAQKEARARAEQQTAAARAQLAAVVANATENKPTLADAREPTASGVVTFGATSGASAELRTSADRVKAPAPEKRIHVVRANETLEAIAKKYYGDPEKWVRIYAANHAQLSGGRPIKPGMELEIPVE